MIELKWTDRSSLEPADALARLQQLTQSKTGWTIVEASSLDLEQSLATSRARSAGAPFVDWYLIGHPDPRTQILIYLHHVIADGWSIPILWGDLAAVYEAFER